MGIVKSTPGFPNLCPIAILGQVSLCCVAVLGTVGCLGASRASPHQVPSTSPYPVMITRNVSREFQMDCGSQCCLSYH